jgi:hypothetical protein
MWFNVSRAGGLSLSLTLLLGAPATSFAQSPAPSQPPTGQGPLTLERIDNRLVVTPDVRFTAVNGRDATLAGGTVGWLMDKTLMVGGGAYVLANRADDFKMAYGGLVLEYAHWGDRAVSVGLRGLVGAGTATLSETFSVPFGGAMFPLPGRIARMTSTSRFGARPGGAFDGTTGIRDVRYVFDDTFFVFEPQVNLRARLVDWLSIEGGAGYRVIASDNDLSSRLDGVAGTVGVRIGVR